MYGISKIQWKYKKINKITYNPFTQKLPSFFIMVYFLLALT